MNIFEKNLTPLKGDVRSSISDRNAKDFQRTIKCLIVLFIAISIAAPIYLFMHSKLYAMGVIGVAVVGLSFYHTPFALMFLYFFFPLEGAVQSSQIGAGSRLIGLIVMVSFLVTRFRGKLTVSPSFYVIILFNLYAISSIIWAVNPEVAVEGIKSLTLNVILLIILVNTIKDVKQMKMLLWGLFIGGILASIMIAFGQVSYAGGGEKMGRVVLGEGTSPNVLGNSILISFLAGFYLFNEKGKFNKFFFLLTGPLMLYAILNTQNRTALGTAIIAPIMAFLFSAKGKYLVKNILGIFLVCLLGFGIYYIILNTNILTDLAKQRLRETNGNLEESGRIDQWKIGFEFLAERPINGWGWKNFPEKFPAHRKALRSAHNNIVAISGELGLMGLLLWISIYFVIMRNVFKLSHPPIRWLAIAFIIYTLITGMTSTTIITKGYWYALGFALLAGYISKEIDSNEELNKERQINSTDSLIFNNENRI